MNNSTNQEHVEGRASHAEDETGITRRSFAKKLAGLSFLSCVTAMMTPEAALAWLDGGFSERDDLADAMKSLVKTYNHTKPYPHKFNDALVKARLRQADFAVRKGLEEEFAEHEAHILSPILEGRVKRQVAEIGPDRFLFWNFERTSCSYQLYERIDIKEGERSFPCPYKDILEEIDRGLGSYKITWNDVCTKLCTPRMEAFAKKAGGVKFTIEPGEICKVKVI
jgi:hypothetical protein